MRSSLGHHLITFTSCQCSVKRASPNCCVYMICPNWSYIRIFSTQLQSPGIKAVKVYKMTLVWCLGANVSTVGQEKNNPQLGCTIQQHQAYQNIVYLKPALSSYLVKHKPVFHSRYLPYYKTPKKIAVRKSILFLIFSTLLHLQTCRTNLPKLNTKLEYYSKK